MTDLGRQQLQELYFHLDRTGAIGNTYLAWYGQLRAEEQTHAEALEGTIEHFHLRDYEWYRKRLERKDNERASA